MGRHRWFTTDAALYYISLYLGWEMIYDYDKQRNTNMNNKDHLVGQLTTKTRAIKMGITYLFQSFSGKTDYLMKII